jgi:hypothetical protein
MSRCWRPLALLLLLPWRPPALEAQVIDRVLAKVGAQVITLSDARAAIALGLVRPAGAADPIAEALAALIDRQLMLAEANRYASPAPDPAAVESRLAEIRARFASEDDWKSALGSSAMTIERLRDTVRDNLRIEAYVDQLFSAPAQPTDEEVARYYEQHRTEFVRDGRQLSFDDARDLARERATVARRQVLVAAWLSRLRDRTTVVNMFSPPR